MRRVFADTLYWIALANPSDQWHQAAREIEARLTGVQIVTTEEVLTELLASLAGTGVHRRIQAAAMVRAVLAAPHILVLPQSHESFLDGLDFYEHRADKGYSLTDCISMNACRRKASLKFSPTTITSHKKDWLFSSRTVRSPSPP